MRFNPTKDWFSDEELTCQHTGILEFDGQARRGFSVIRDDCGFALPVSSGYRHPSHPIEARKRNGPGSHSTAVAIDVNVWGAKAYKLIQVAQKHGVLRIGLQQKGPTSSRFVHMDWLGAEGFEHIQYDTNRFPVPWIWTYP